MKRLLSLLAALFLAACAGYDGYGGSGLKPGAATRAEVERVMGAPAMRWREADGGEQLAYPRGPMGYHTYMARIDANGLLAGIENVLDERHFDRIRPGQSEEDVLRILGPSHAPWTVYFAARDELVREWRYCDDWNKAARFDVLFDGTTKKVRSTLRRMEIPSFSRDGAPPACSR